MKIENTSLRELYISEAGRLLLNFSDEKYRKYTNIIMNTKSYKDIITEIPDNLTNLEKVYYVYNKLGIQLYENNSLVYNHINNLSMYYETIRENGYGNCRQMSELWITMLMQAGLIEGFYLTRKPVGVEQVDLRHIDAIIQIDGKLYMTNIIRDTVNMRTGIRNMKFGYVDNDKEFASQIQKEIGDLTVIPRQAGDGELSIEYLDKKIKNVNKYDEIGFPFNFSLQKYHYFEDIIESELIPRMSSEDSYIRRGGSISTNKLFGDSLDESIELDVDIILNFFYRIAPNIDPEICLKYLKTTLEKIYSVRECHKNIVSKEWINNHLRLYQTIGEYDIEVHNKEFPLQTLLAIKRNNPIKEKYAFYKLQNGCNPRKVSYNEMIENMRLNKTKICSKFSLKRTNALEELEL